MQRGGVRRPARVRAFECARTRLSPTACPRKWARRGGVTAEVGIFFAAALVSGCSRAFQARVCGWSLSAPGAQRDFLVALTGAAATRTRHTTAPASAGGWEPGVRGRGRGPRTPGPPSRLHTALRWAWSGVPWDVGTPRLLAPGLSPGASSRSLLSGFAQWLGVGARWGDACTSPRSAQPLRLAVGQDPPVNRRTARHWRRGRLCLFFFLLRQ